MQRCQWCTDDFLYRAYHDEEWGVPVYDDKTLFEFLILEGAQAGLSWLTVLRKRENYREVFADFNAQKVARFSDAKLERILQDKRIIRNRLKVFSTRSNATVFLDIADQYGSFANYLWNFVDGSPIQNHWRHAKDVPATSSVSDALSKDLKKRGCSFVGSTIIYAYMQAVGMVNDHTTDCFAHAKCQQLAKQTAQVGEPNNIP